MKKGKFGAVMLMVLVSVLAMAVMMVSIRAAEGATITAKAGTGGLIAPSGTITVKDGATQQFGIAASSGYTILSVTGCNGTLSKTSSGFMYTTGRVTGSCIVTPSFKLLVPKITSFKINNDAAETTTQSVTLNFTTATGSIPTQYRTSERADFGGVAWKTLGGATSALPFDLSAGAGSKTVYLQLMDSSTGGISNVMSDTINLQARQLYNISGHDFYAAAESAGFVSRADRIVSNESIGCTCVIIEGPADNLQANQVAARVVGSANCHSDYANPACEFTFFEGKTLQNGFVFKFLSGVQYPIVAGCGMNLSSTASVGSNSIRFTLQGWTVGSSECQYIIDPITLEGPANTDWHTALGLKP